MQNKLTRKLVLSGMFAALICVVTIFVRIPVPLAWNGAYINAGDSVIYTAGVVLGGPWAACASGIGSMLADLLVGSANYAPGTLVIKALMGLIVGMAAFRKQNWFLYLGLMIAAAIWMVVGYTAYEFFFFAGMNIAVESASIPSNLIQAAGGVVIGLPLAMLVRRIIPGNWLDAFKKQDA
jgi:uncharacterized membrane protein